MISQVTHSVHTFTWPIIKQKIDIHFGNVQNTVNVAWPQQGQWSWEDSWAVCWLWWWINPQCRQCWADNPQLLGSAASSYAPHHGHGLGPELLTVDISKGNIKLIKLTVHFTKPTNNPYDINKKVRRDHHRRNQRFNAMLKLESLLFNSWLYPLAIFTLSLPVL